MTLRWPAIGVAIACFALQLVAYQLSWLTADHPTSCLAIPAQHCWPIMASGYVEVMGWLGARWKLEEAVAVFVPLAMWIAVACAVHAPRARSRAALGYAAVLVLAAGFATITLRHKPEPELVSPPAAGVR
jgi:hypothetical protein